MPKNWEKKRTEKRRLETCEREFSVFIEPLASVDVKFSGFIRNIFLNKEVIWKIKENFSIREKKSRILKVNKRQFSNFSSIFLKYFIQFHLCGVRKFVFNFSLVCEKEKKGKISFSFLFFVNESGEENKKKECRREKIHNFDLLYFFAPVLMFFLFRVKHNKTWNINLLQWGEWKTIKS